MTIKTDSRSGDFQEYLIRSLREDPELAAEYLNAVLEDGDDRVIQVVARQIQQALDSGADLGAVGDH